MVKQSRNTSKVGSYMHGDAAGKARNTKKSRVRHNHPKDCTCGRHAEDVAKAFLNRIDEVRTKQNPVVSKHKRDYIIKEMNREIADIACATFFASQPLAILHEFFPADKAGEVAETRELLIRSAHRFVAYICSVKDTLMTDSVRENELPLMQKNLIECPHRLDFLKYINELDAINQQISAAIESRNTEMPKG